MTLHWLDPHDPDVDFPSTEQALQQPNGLLAIGGDLSESRLIKAYSQGIFPWFNPDEPILWWSPDPRTVFDLDRIHISASLRRAINRQDYRVTLDSAFRDVITACAKPRPAQQGTWLGNAMIDAYTRLHEGGHAHSIEIWRNDELIGGLYGVALGAAFFGESMFSRQSNGSKLALVWLARYLRHWKFHFLDGQVGSPHLFRMGAQSISRNQFLLQLNIALKRPGKPGKWAASGKAMGHL